MAPNKLGANVSASGCSQQEHLILTQVNSQCKCFTTRVWLGADESKVAWCMTKIQRGNVEGWLFRLKKLRVRWGGGQGWGSKGG